jgi:uncharacterized protein (TIGR00369 family)
MADTGFLSADELNALLPGTLPGLLGLVVDQHEPGLELKTNYLGTAREGRIATVATNVHAGRTTQVWDAVVRDETRDKVIALFRCTQSVLWPR